MKHLLFRTVTTVAVLLLLLIIAAFSFQAPVATKGVSQIEKDKATCNYTYQATIRPVEHGVCISNKTNPAIGGQGVVVFRGRKWPPMQDTYATTLLNEAAMGRLKSGVKYYVKAYVKTKDGTVMYGNEISFTTL